MIIDSRLRAKIMARLRRRESAGRIAYLTGASLTQVNALKAAMVNRPWSTSEDSRLRRIWAAMPPGARREAGLRQAVPGRTAMACQARAKALGLNRPGNRWSPAELAVIDAAASWAAKTTPATPIDARTLKARLPKRTLNAIRHQLAYRGLAALAVVDPRAAGRAKARAEERARRAARIAAFIALPLAFTDAREARFAITPARIA